MRASLAESVIRTQLAFASPLISEASYRAALGGPRSDLNTVLGYLKRPLGERPLLTPYFDPVWYCALYPEVLEQREDPQFHFLTVGISEYRSPHPLIDFEFLRHYDEASFVRRPVAEALIGALRGGLFDPSAYFSCEHYVEQLGPAADTVPELLGHFLEHGLHRGLTPHKLFDPAWYAERYPDVPKAPYAALRHFVLVGDRAGRAASEAFDGGRYLRRYPDIASAQVPALWHYVTNGVREGRQIAIEIAAAPPPRRLRREAPTGAALPTDGPAAYERLRARIAAQRSEAIERHAPTPPVLKSAHDPAASLAALSLPRVRAPKVSVLIPVHDALRHTVECLMSLATGRVRTRFEVIVADDASTDPGMAALAGVANLRLIRNERNQGFLRTCNAAFAAARGEYVLLLNSDAQLLPGALDALAAMLDGDPAIAAAAPRLIYPDGRLQEAGCRLDAAGVSTMIGLFGDAASPAWSHDRDVQYASAAALMLRRAAIGGALFDERFAPAYCEDADLCLRLLDAGHRVRLCAAATVAHHLSVSTARDGDGPKLRGVRANQQKLAEKWPEALERQARVRVLAFYLPQFHPTPENDLWWGRGFTEWSNVVRAAPSFEGHRQPRLPADLGLYDLRVPAVPAAQAALAARYGIDGFCVYYYNFGERRVLDAAFEAIVADPAIRFPFCVCWANENWTRAWDGGESDLLLAQRYDDATLDAVIADAIRYAADPRYIRVRGRPMLLVYRPLQLPDPAAFAARARAAFAAAGEPGLHLVYVESMEAAGRGLRPEVIGFDAAVEFPPHGRGVPAADPIRLLKEGWTGYRYDYEETVLACLQGGAPGYPRYPGLFPGWDNTPRQSLRGTSFDDASPTLFQAYAEAKIEEAQAQFVGEERLVFVNAWNEWAEGAVLEPDQAHGHGWLEALRHARLATDCL